MLHYFQVYSIVTQRLHILWCAPHNKFSNYLSLCTDDDMINCIPCAVHYVPVTYFVSGALYFLLSVPFSPHSPIP